MNTTALYRVSSLIALGFLLLGCQNNAAVSDPFFPPETEVRASQGVSEIQAANGARDDRTLYPQHFTNDELNSLGRDKIKLILQTISTPVPLVFYMDIPAGDPRASRWQAATEKYFQEFKYPTDQLTFRTGPNPDLAVPAAMSLSRLSKTSSDSEPNQQDKTSGYGADVSNVPTGFGPGIRTDMSNK